MIYKYKRQNDARANTYINSQKDFDVKEDFCFLTNLPIGGCAISWFFGRHKAAILRGVNIFPESELFAEPDSCAVN